jgi:hypothetical protein
MEGFRVIGALEGAKILARAMQLFGQPYPRDRYDRERLLPARQCGPRGEWDPFYQLDERFYEWADHWEDAANTYAGQVIAREG